VGKGGKPKVEVTEYYMSEHFGVCSGPVDAITRIIVKEKDAWVGEQSELASTVINLPELFGGVKKEGGLKGVVTFLPGASDQVLPDTLAQRLGRPNGASAPGYRGITSLFFYGAGRGGVPSIGDIVAAKLGKHRSVNGFYWTANTPYLPGVWATVRRAPVGLNPSYAMIYSGTRTPRAICFALDRSGSMDGERLATMKAAISNVLDLISASAESGVQIDLCAIGWSTSSSSITRRSIDADDVSAVDSFVQALTASGNTNFNSAANAAATFFNNTSASITERFLFFITDGEPTDNPATAGATIFGISPAVKSYGINIILEDISGTEQIDNTPEDGVPIVDGDDPTGLRNAVIDALFADNVIGDANPAHIIYECLTNTDWGMGSPEAAIDKPAFESAALTLYAEAFGLSLMWTRQTTIQEFVQEILDHIQGVLFVDPATGLLTLKLIRDDYNPDDLPVIDPDNADLSNFSRKLWGDIVNEIAVTWTNPVNEQEETITVQDDASIATQGGIVSDSRNYYGVRNADLAQRLAYRDLRSAGQPLASCEAEVDRTQWRLRPASVIKLTWPEYGLSEIVMRVTSIDYGRPGDMTIKLSLMEDVYGLDIGDYEPPPSSEWEDPSAPPAPLETVEIFTLPLFFAADTTVSAFVESPEYPEVLAGVLATDDSEDTFSYELWGEVALPNGDLEWQSLGTNNIIGRAGLVSDINAEATSTGVEYEGLIGQTAPTAGGFAIIGDEGETGNEIAMIDAVDEDGTITLVRGVLDTVPRAWPAETPVWFVDGNTLFEDSLVRAAGETVEYKLLSRTSQGLLALESAPLESATLSERPWLPNRPANVKAHGEAWSSEDALIDATGRSDPWVTVTWANRNRLTEDSQVLSWTDGDVTPEDGQTTTIIVLPADSETPLATHDGLSGTSFDVPDSSFGGHSIVRLRVTAERNDDDGSFVALQYFEHWVQVEPLTFDSTAVTFDSDTWTMDSE
jgi:uncharacterized protein YegL